MDNKYDIQLPKESGYNSAISYYKALKKQFINQATQNFTKEGAQQAEQWSNQLITTISNAVFVDKTGRYKEGATSFSILNEIFSDFAKHPDMQAIIQQAIKRIDEEKQDLDFSNEKVRHQVIADIMKQMEPEQKILIQNTLTAVVNNPSRGTDANTLHDIINRANQMFRIALSATLQKRQVYMLSGWPMRTMQGYVREQSELNGLQQIFKNTPVRVTHGGSKKVNKVETVFDNILSIMEFSDEAFNQQVIGTANIPLKASDVKSSLLPQIKFYGEQVKSFNLTLDKVSSKTAEGHRIAYNAELKNALMTTSKYITLKQNLAFMAKYQNIIKTFGPATLLFSSGAGRQWMHEFISDFRKRNYYLMFTYGDAGKITGNIELTHPVIIERKIKTSTIKT